MSDLDAAPESVAHLPFANGGVCGRLIDAIDWSTTSLGPMASWPASLRTLVGTLLQSRHPMFLWWGPELLQFYNDAYLPSFGVGKHPAAMGQRGKECWGEIWPIIWPQIDAVMTAGSASWNEDALVPIFRNGRVEEVYWTYGYSPVADDRGDVKGTLVVCTETTARVVLERRLQTLRRLAEATSACHDTESIVTEALRVAGDARVDIPFALLYRPNGSEDDMTFVGGTGLAPEHLPLLADDVRALLPAQITGTPSSVPPIPLPTRIAVLPGPWPETPTHLVALRSQKAGIVIFGVSARLPFEAAYARFFVDFIDQMERAFLRVESFRARAAIEAERRNLLLQAPVATALFTGPRHLFELANPTYLRMVGREVIGKTYGEAFPEVIGTPIHDVLDRVYATGEPYTAEEFRVPLDRRGDGTLQDCFYKFSLQPVRDGAGAVYGMMVVAVDVTEQVSARRVLEQSNVERQRLVDELEAANRAKDAFLATVSHELRTPLNAILGWSRMLRSGNVAPDKVDGALEVIERNSLAQVQLVEDLLDVSRIISGKLRLEVHRVQVGPIVEAAVESVLPAIRAKDIHFDPVLEDGAGLVSADPHRLQQLVWNLLSNAVKFTPRGGKIRVVVERVDSSIQLTVSDSGQGISAENLTSVFERFKQADGSAARIHGGLGLGLAIALHIVELHGGTLHAHSDGVGRGATFVVRLPLAPLRPERDALFRHPSAPPTKPYFEHAKELQGLTILLVDDEADTRDLLAAVLQQLGSSVLTADSGAEALSLLDRASPRVLVCDIGMPGMDGYEFIETVRKRSPEKGGRIMALALTAYASPEDRRRALRSGFQMHLAKPVEPAELVAVLANLAQLAIALS